MSGMESAVSTALRDFVACCVCKLGLGEGENEALKDPVVLPCLHTICAPCLRVWTQNSHTQQGKDTVRCPACLTQCPAPPGGMRALPQDTFHTTLRKSLMGTDADTKATATATPPSCGLHNKELLAMYCETCHVPVCKPCCQGSHRGHQVQALEDAARILDMQLSGGTQSLMLSSISEAESMMGNLQRSSQNMEADLSDTRTRVKQRSHKLCADIRKAEAAHIEEINQIEEERAAQIDKLQETLEKFRANVEALREYTAALSTGGSAYDKATHIPAITQQLQRQSDVQLETVTWESQMLTAAKGHKTDLYSLLGKVDIKEKTVLSYQGIKAGLFEDLHLKEKIQLQCSQSKHLVVAALFNDVYLTHCSQEKLCFHSMDGDPVHEVKVPELCFPRCPAIVDSTQGRLVLADLGPEWTDAMDDDDTPHVQGFLHWLTMTEELCVDKHDIKQLQCMPTSVSVDPTGQLLVTTLCTNNEHPPSLLVFHNNTTFIRVIHLPPELVRFPAGAIRTGAGVFAVLDWGNEQVVWVNQHGRVMQTYGKASQNAAFSTQPVLSPLSPKCFEILDSPKYSQPPTARKRLELLASPKCQEAAPEHNSLGELAPSPNSHDHLSKSPTAKAANGPKSPTAKPQGNPVTDTKTLKQNFLNPTGNMGKATSSKQPKEKAASNQGNDLTKKQLELTRPKKLGEDASQGPVKKTVVLHLRKPNLPKCFLDTPSPKTFRKADSLKDQKESAGPTAPQQSAKVTRSGAESFKVIQREGSQAKKKRPWSFSEFPWSPRQPQENGAGPKQAGKPGSSKELPEVQADIKVASPQTRDQTSSKHKVPGSQSRTTSSNPARPISPLAAKSPVVSPKASANGAPVTPMTQSTPVTPKTSVASPVTPTSPVTPKTPSSPIKHVEENLGSPQHLVQHPDGSLLVADSDNHRVHLVSAQGHLLRHLLGRRDGLRKPKYLHLDAHRGLLYVKNGGDRGLVQAFKYNPRHSIDTQLTLKLHM